MCFLKIIINNNNCNSLYKKVDIKFSVHDTFLEEPTSGMLKIKKMGKAK